jgi:multimeric flavodoxin WrbA
LKKVLGIVGSPRRNGNTHVLVAEILRGADEGNAHTEMLFLADLKINECDGCHRCWKGMKCPKKDDMLKLYPKIIESDILLFGTPVYWYGPTALMKLLIDRFVYFNCPRNREKIRGKKAAIVAPFEDESIDTASLLLHFFEKSLAYLEMSLAGTLLVPGVTKPGEVRKKSSYMKEAYQLGQKIALQALYPNDNPETTTLHCYQGKTDAEK